ncbi:MAG: hypothetical protein IIT46_12685 [Lachnospiraceae bacterium]|nr:hypothetical protein [Lachnospiraceae bacterium]
MRKIYDYIPGEHISDKFIADSIYELIKSINFSKWVEVDERVYLLDFFLENEDFYVIYLDPGGVVERLYKTCREDIINFMKEHINFKYGEGVDIAICTRMIDNAVVCNHDGQIFILK